MTSLKKLPFFYGMKTADHYFVGYSGGKHPQITAGWNERELELELPHGHVALIHKSVICVHGSFKPPSVDQHGWRVYILKRPQPATNILNLSELAKSETIHALSYYNRTVVNGTGYAQTKGDIIKDVEYHVPPFVHGHKKIKVQLWVSVNDVFNWLEVKVCYSTVPVGTKQLLSSLTSHQHSFMEGSI